MIDSEEKQYMWNCDNCEAKIYSDKKLNENDLICRFNCYICKREIEIKFKNLKNENNTNI